MVKKIFYVTTPIYYPNDIPHIGHAYTTVVGDVISRWHKLNGEEVFFLTGTDEHGKKIEEAAAKKGKKPKEFVDELVPKFKDAWKKLNIEYSRFIRTTDKDHEEVVKKLLQKVYDKGDIYLGEYEGYYCTGCEAYYTEKDLEDGCCPIHKTKIEKLKEKSYFFKLSKYQKPLLELYNKNKEFLSPEFRNKEIINRVKEGLQDLSISRTTFKWGIELPFDKKHITYVWFDALTNYYSATRQKGKEKFWPADVHLVGKDISWFHCVIWPAMLLSAGIKTPKKVFSHGWWTFDNEKISKSRGKVINIDELIEIAGVDSARYFLFRETPFGQDGDFSEKALIDRHNNELADKLGNLVSRVSALIEKDGLQKTKNELLDRNLLRNVNPKKTDIIRNSRLKLIENYMQNYEFDKALNEIFAFIDLCNEYVQKTQPWKTHDKKVLYELADSIKSIAILLWPFIPSTSEKIAKQFGFKIDYKEIKKPLKVSNTQNSKNFGATKSKRKQDFEGIKKTEILFKKIEIGEKQEDKNINKPKEHSKIEGIANMSNVEYSDWEKLDLRVGKIINVEDIDGADKLYKLTVDIGNEKRTVCAGIKKFYAKDQLKNKKIILFVNLKPRMLKGIESQGMILAAVNEKEDKVVLIAPEKDIEVGAKVR